MKSSEIGSETISTLQVEKREKNVESRTFNANEFFGALKRKKMVGMVSESLTDLFFFDIDKYNEEVNIRHNCTMIVIRIREEYL